MVLCAKASFNEWKKNDVRGILQKMIPLMLHPGAHDLNRSVCWMILPYKKYKGS